MNQGSNPKVVVSGGKEAFELYQQLISQGGIDLGKGRTARISLEEGGKRALTTVGLDETQRVFIRRMVETVDELVSVGVKNPEEADRFVVVASLNPLF